MILFEKFEDSKGVGRSRKSKGGQYNDEKKNNKWRNNVSKTTKIYQDRFLFHLVGGVVQGYPFLADFYLTKVKSLLIHHYYTGQVQIWPDRLPDLRHLDSLLEMSSVLQNL